MDNIIFGIDPGTVITGYAAVSVIGEEYTLLDYGCIKPPAKEALFDRYLIIHEALDALFEKYRPHVMAVETQFVHKNPSSAIKLGMARGVAILTARKKGISVFEYAPKMAKKAITGNGSASKLEVQRMMQLLFKLKKLPEPEDAADALAIALCHAHRRFNH